MKQNMTLRLELFVDDIPASLDFYTRVLGFTPEAQHADGYLPLTNGNVTLALNRRAALPEGHPIRAGVNERLGRGIEIVLEVDDVVAMYTHVLSQDWPLASELKYQPWGMTDFRLVDPDGYYVRVTSKARG